MKRIALVVLFTAVLQAFTPAYAQWGGVKPKGKIKKGNLIYWYKDGQIADSNVNLTNFTWQVGYTNVAQILASVGQTNGIAQLDENGKIDASLVETITVVFVGGPAIDE